MSSLGRNKKYKYAKVKRESKFGENKGKEMRWNEVKENEA